MTDIAELRYANPSPYIGEIVDRYPPNDPKLDAVGIDCASLAQPL